MGLKLKKQICDRDGLISILNALAQNICQRDIDWNNFALIGILKNGFPIAKYLAERIELHTGIKVPVVGLDITLYRDDMIDTQHEPYNATTEIPFPTKGRELMLVDDVFFTGRTARAALSSMLSFGRPKVIYLAVAVDRGHRELPIQPDFVGLSLKTTRDEGVRVRVQPSSMETGIYIYEES